LHDAARRNKTFRAAYGTDSLIQALMELPVILKAGEDGFIVAECPVIPGCISQRRTRREALRNVREAIELCLEVRDKEGWDLAPRYDLTRGEDRRT